jgi:predicted phosphoadenosine phosphosulfate sulfurtransferase
MNVLEAAQRRMRLVFDHFERVVVSVSGGKDSQVLFCLAQAEAERRGRTVEAFFLDQEAEYAGTIDVIEWTMRQPSVIPRWYQVPLRMTNATSFERAWLHAWGPDEPWMRPRSPLAITEAPGAPDRFYDFFPWYEKQTDRPTAFLVGLRSRESLTRWRAVAKNAGYRGWTWSTHTKVEGTHRFYPVFDWHFGDIWKYLSDNNVPYNRIYDRMYMLRGGNERTMRVSFLVHEQSFRSLGTLQELEPDTYVRLVARLGGVHAAALYCEEPTMFSAKTRPSAFDTWRAYRDHLLATTPGDHTTKFRRRFAKQPDDEATCREQIRQVLTNDWENNIPIRRISADKLRSTWWDRL